MKENPTALDQVAEPEAEGARGTIQVHEYSLELQSALSFVMSLLMMVTCRCQVS